MLYELLQGADAHVTYAPACHPASATVALVDDRGVTRAEPAVTVPTVASTVVTVTNPTALVLDGVAGLVPGEHAWLAPLHTTGSPVLVSRVDPVAKTIELEGAPAAQIAPGDLLGPGVLRVTIPGAALATRGLNWRLAWRVVEAVTGAERAYTSPVHIVRCQFRGLGPEDVSRYVGYAHPRLAEARNAGWHRDLAARANDRVRRVVQGRSAYQHLIGDPGALYDAQVAALRLELAYQGHVPQQGVSVEDMGKQMRHECYLALDSLQWHDDNDDGVVDPGEVRRPLAGVFRFGR